MIKLAVVLEDGEAQVWAMLDDHDFNQDPTHRSESFIIGTGPTLADALMAAQRDLRQALDKVVRRLEATAAPPAAESVTSPATPPHNRHVAIGPDGSLLSYTEDAVQRTIRGAMGDGRVLAVVIEMPDGNLALPVLGDPSPTLADALDVVARAYRAAITPAAQEPRA